MCFKPHIISSKSSKTGDLCEVSTLLLTHLRCRSCLFLRVILYTRPMADPDFHPKRGEGAGAGVGLSE